MKNKGFTLIELLGIVVILAIIVVVAVPAIINTRKNSEIKDYNRSVDDIILATENYIQVNSDACPNLVLPNSTCELSLQTLIDSGYIKNNINIKNPENNVVIDNTYNIKITVNSDSTLKYELKQGE